MPPIQLSCVVKHNVPALLRGSLVPSCMINNPHDALTLHSRTCMHCMHSMRCVTTYLRALIAYIASLIACVHSSLERLHACVHIYKNQQHQFSLENMVSFLTY